MWSAGGELKRAKAPRAFLGVSRVGWADGDGAVVWEPVEGAFQGLARLLSMAERARPPGQMGTSLPLAMFLSGAVARPFNVGPVRGLKRWSEALMIARSLAPALTGHTSPCEVWMDASPADRPVLAVAMESALLQALQDDAASRLIRLTSLRPWWSLALQAPWADSAAELMAMDDGDALTLLRRSGSSWEPSTFCPRPGPDQVATLLRRQAAANDLPDEACRFADLAPPAIDQLTAAMGGEDIFFRMRSRLVEFLENER